MEEMISADTADKAIRAEGETVDTAAAPIRNESPAGKFRDAKQLAKAYENLEREFTRKSQMLSELQRKSVREPDERQETTAAQERETAFDLGGEDAENETPCGAVENAQEDVREDMEETDVSDKERAQAEECSSTVEPSPRWDSDDWDASVDKFIAENPAAAELAPRMGQILMSDKNLAAREDCLQCAFMRAVNEEFRTPRQLLEDEKFREEIVGDKRIARTIIDKYLEELSTSRPPKLSDGGKISLTPPDRPESIREAGEIVKTMLSNRRI